jgi:hypothetical protein
VGARCYRCVAGGSLGGWAAARPSGSNGTGTYAKRGRRVGVGASSSCGEFVGSAQRGSGSSGVASSATAALLVARRALASSVERPASTWCGTQSGLPGRFPDRSRAVVSLRLERRFSGSCFSALGQSVEGYVGHVQSSEPVVRSRLCTSVDRRSKHRGRNHDRRDRAPWHGTGLTSARSARDLRGFLSLGLGVAADSLVLGIRGARFARPLDVPPRVRILVRVGTLSAPRSRSAPPPAPAAAAPAPAAGPTALPCPRPTPPA